MKKNLQATLWRVIGIIVLFIISPAKDMQGAEKSTWINGFPYLLRERGDSSYLEISMMSEFTSMGGPFWGEPPYSDYQYPLDENGILVIPDEEEFNGKTYPVKVIDLWTIRHQQEAKGIKLGSNIKYVKHGNFCHFPKAKSVDLGQAEWFDTDVVSYMPELESLIINIPPKCVLSGFNGLGLKEYDFQEWISNLSSNNVPEEFRMNYTVLIDYDSRLFCGWPNLKKLDLSQLPGIPEFYSFSDLSGVEELKMPECIHWSAYGLINLPNLKTIWLPNEYDFDWELYPYCYDVYNVPNVEIIYSPCPTAPLFDYMGGPIQIECIDITPIYTFGCESIDTEKCIVYVPEGSVESYRKSPSWEAFHNILEYDFENNVPISGIKDVTMAGENRVKYYDAQGMEIKDISSYKGFYIEVNPAASQNVSKVRVK